MNIRKACSSDFDQTSALYDKVTLHLENTVNYPNWTHKIYPSSETVKEGIDTDSLFVCTENERITGVFILNTDPGGDYAAGDWSVFIPEGEYMVIHALAVDPDFSRKGVGRRMVEFCMDYAKENGYKAIRLDAVPKNLPARHMYESLGFRFAGEKDLKRYETGIPSFALYELILH